MMKLSKLSASLQGLLISCALLLVSCAEVDVKDLAKVAYVEEPSVSLAGTQLTALTFDGA